MVRHKLSGKYKDLYYEIHANVDSHHLVSDARIMLSEFVIDWDRITRLDLKENLVYAFQKLEQAQFPARGAKSGAKKPDSEG